ncbi:flagellar motor protein MotB [Sulfurifustis variabilis]|uniref:Flagellar motor protein MotB n=1 Tax=Sulfurifustis variabilis TaxID=1675686 RepID=A0A1B4V217_9GAMM|nr:porin family protein [Sulfurifustis variabilis]BAU47503.1 flagellar motor protein MotB [Sulfurifustis variabilis]
MPPDSDHRGYTEWRRNARRAVTGALGLVLTALCLPAPAQTPGGYAGIGFGRSSVDIDGGALEQNLLDFAAAEGVAIASSSSSDDGTDTSVKLFLGYRFNRYFGIEGAFVDLGDFDASASATDAAFGDTLTVRTELDFFAFSFAGLAHLPVSRSFSVYGKFGFYAWDLDLTERVRLPGFATSTARASDDGSDFVYGAGLEWDIGRQFAVRAEWERYNEVGEGSLAGEDDIDVVGVSGLFRW